MHKQQMAQGRKYPIRLLEWPSEMLHLTPITERNSLTLIPCKYLIVSKSTIAHVLCNNRSRNLSQLQQLTTWQVIKPCSSTATPLQGYRKRACTNAIPIKVIEWQKNFGYWRSFSVLATDIALRFSTLASCSNLNIRYCNLRCLLTTYV